MRGQILVFVGSVFVASGLSFGAAPSAFAADLPIKAPVYKTLAPAFSWAGFYIGGHVGGAFANSHWTNTNPPATGTDDANIDPSGFLGGGQIGFNYQVNNYVLGIEGDGSGTSLSKTQDSCYTDFVGIAGQQSCKAKANWFATLTGRLGVTWDKALLYAKGGAAWGHFKYENGCPACTSTSYFASETRSGWTAGGGIEYALANNWTVKVEYNYLDFGKDTLTFVGTAGDTFAQDIDSHVNVVKVGANYLFGGPR